MLTSDFDFDLPDHLIASEPAPRGASRMLVLDGDTLADSTISALPQYLRQGDALVVNDTRVIPARLFAHRQGNVESGRLELLLIDREDETTWQALVRPGRKAKAGTRWTVVDRNGNETVDFEVVARPEPDSTDRGIFGVRFSEPVEPHLDRAGHVPLPPYIRRPDEDADRQRYQTVYAEHDGAIAAPTAGLHFDDTLLGEIRDLGIEIVPITLHVGIGTFKPVTATLAHEHRMDSERYSVSEDAAVVINRTRASGGRIVAVGTTVVRTLESIADEPGHVKADSGATDLFILPGHRFRAVDALLTNFHLPQSTLLMLVSAFAGRERVLNAYRHAIEQEYRFYSYGDCMLMGRTG